MLSIRQPSPPTPPPATLECPALSELEFAAADPDLGGGVSGAQLPDASQIIAAIATASSVLPAAISTGQAAPFAVADASVAEDDAQEPEPLPPRIIRRAQESRAAASDATPQTEFHPQTWRGFALGFALSGVAGGLLYGLLTAV